MAESRFTIAEYEAELAVDQQLQALAHQLDTIPRARDTESDINIDPWRPLFENE